MCGLYWHVCAVICFNVFTCSGVYVYVYLCVKLYTCVAVCCAGMQLFMCVRVHVFMCVRVHTLRAPPSGTQGPGQPLQSNRDEGLHGPRLTAVAFSLAKARTAGHTGPFTGLETRALGLATAAAAVGELGPRWGSLGVRKLTPAQAAVPTVPPSRT